MAPSLTACLIMAALVIGCDGSPRQTAETSAPQGSSWRFPVPIGPDSKVVVSVLDRSDVVIDARPSVDSAGVPPIGGIAVKILDVDSRSLLLQVSASLCDEASEIQITNGVGGRLVVDVEAPSSECDAIGVSYSIVLDFIRAVSPEDLIRHTAMDEVSRWGVYVGDAGSRRPLDVKDGTGSIVAVDFTDAMPVVPPDPPGVVALVDAPNRMRLIWLADDCEESFSLDLVPAGSKIRAEGQSLAIETDDCGLASRPLGVAISLQDPVAQSIDAVLIRSR